MFRRHPLLSLLTVAYLGGLVWITLTPSSDDFRADSVVYLLLDIFQSNASTAWLNYNIVEFAANVILFVPMGVFVVLLFGRRLWWAGIGAGVLAACWIELAQGIWFAYRVTDMRDIASNTLGTVLGVMLALLITWPAANRHRALVAARAARQASA